MYKQDEVGKRLQKLRKLRGNSREETAKSIGRTLRYYGDIERGSCGMSLETLIRLADLYHVSLDYLVFGVTEDSVSIKEEEIRYAMRKLGNLEEKTRDVVLEMLNLFEY